MTQSVINRRSLLAGIGIFMLPVAQSSARALPEIKAFRNPGCGGCEKWAEHLRANGFAVTLQDDPDLDARRAEAGVPANLAGCHTAFVDNYIIEGHVPVEDIVRFLAGKPDALGLAVPGMPMGSPGMETDTTQDDYDVVLFKSDGTTSVYASHKAT